MMSNINALNESGAKQTVRVLVEYCTQCGYNSKCLALSNRIRNEIPDAEVVCTEGRQGDFEVTINDILVYSMRQTLALPDFNEVTAVAKSALEGGPITKVKAQQPITCVIS